jgi:hypothetical protein
MSGPFEVLDAFVDGELVDADDVKRALSEPEGRDFLVDAWLLRNVVQDEMTTDAAVPAPSRQTAPRRQSWAIAAAVAGVSLLGGFLVGTRLPNVLTPARLDPPAATATVPSPPATLPAPAPVPVSTSFPLPTPTRVIQLEFQTNANVSAGG